MDYENQVELEKLFRYENGKLLWATPRRKIRVGQEAGCLSKSGYRVVRVQGKLLYTHRLIWMLLKGPIPPDHTIDHINGDKIDNRLENLRLASHSENCRNRKKYSNNTTGFKGVSWSTTAEKFEARIKTDGVQKVIGYFQTPEEAHAAYVKAAQELHGEFHQA